jgi:hypothetical protein
VSLKIGQLPTAIGSPPAAVEDQGGVFSDEVARKIKALSRDRLDREVGKKISSIELTRHMDLPYATESYQ